MLMLNYQHVNLASHTMYVANGWEPRLRGTCSLGRPESASCVQRLDDSRTSAIRITSRSSLRSSSVREPRYPLLGVIYNWLVEL